MRVFGGKGESRSQMLMVVNLKDKLICLYSYMPGFTTHTHTHSEAAQQAARCHY